MKPSRRSSLSGSIAHRAKKERGQTLVGVLVTASVMAVVSMGFLSMFKSQTKATRNIAALGGVNDLSHALDTLFESQNCANPGATGPYYLYGGAQAVVVVAGGTYTLLLDTLKFSNGSIALVNPPDTTLLQMIQPYSLAPKTALPPGINLIALGGNSPNGTGFRFPFQMRVNFTAASGPPPLPLTKFITIYTGPLTGGTYPVTGACYGGAAPHVPDVFYFQSSGGVHGVSWSTIPGLSQTLVLTQRAHLLIHAYGYARAFHPPTPGGGAVDGIGVSTRVTVNGTSYGDATYGQTLVESASPQGHLGWDLLYQYDATTPGSYTLSIDGSTRDLQAGSDDAYLCAEWNGTVAGYTLCNLSVTAFYY